MSKGGPFRVILIKDTHDFNPKKICRQLVQQEREARCKSSDNRFSLGKCIFESVVIGLSPRLVNDHSYCRSAKKNNFHW